MKKFIILFFVCLSIISCSITKRHYNNIDTSYTIVNYYDLNSKPITGVISHLTINIHVNDSGKVEYITKTKNIYNICYDYPLDKPTIINNLN